MNPKIEKYNDYKEELTYLKKFIPPFIKRWAEVNEVERGDFLKKEGINNEIGKIFLEYKTREPDVRCPIEKIRTFKKEEFIKFIEDNPQFKELEFPYANF